MRIALRALVVFFVLVGVALAALALFLPRIAGSDAVKQRLQQSARQLLGRDVSWDELDVALLPPRLVVLGPRVAGARPAAPPELEARRVDLRVALLPLLARSVVVDSLEIEGVTLRLARTADGFELPFADAGKAAASAEGSARVSPAPKPEAAPQEAAPLALAIRELRLRDATLELDDRATQPPVLWRLEDVQARAHGSALDAPVQLDMSGRLGTGGTLQVKGSFTLDGVLDLELALDGVVLDPVAPYLGKDQRLAGRASGTIRAKGPAASPTVLSADLSLADAVVEAAGLALLGGVGLKGDLEGGLEKPSGSFELDATDAELRYGDAFHKPRGKRASAAGRLVPAEGGGFAAEDVQLRLAELEAKAALRSGARTRIELDAAPFETRGWGELIPALAAYEPSGTLAFEKLVVQTEPLQVRGRIPLGGLSLRLPDGERVALEGAFEGAGDSLQSQSLQASFAGQTLPLDLAVRGLSGQLRYSLGARTEQADLNALVTALAGKPDAISGPLTSSVELAGPLGGARSPLETMTGSSRLQVGRGRMSGVSILHGAFDRLGTLGEAALLAGSQRGGRTLQRFYGDEFESISGTFKIAKGRARSEDLKLVYRNYQLDLVGALGLVDSALDFKGTLTIGEEIAAELAKDASEEGTPPAPAKSRVLPLAHVGGTLAEPRVELTQQAALAFAASFASSGRLGKLERKLDERLGKGAGREIFGTLEQILGGKKRDAEPAPTPQPPAEPAPEQQP